jgi:hypothetical protein
MADVEIKMKFTSHSPGFISALFLICVVASLIVAGCTSQSAPVPTPTVTTQTVLPTTIAATTVPTVAVTYVPATETTRGTTFKPYTNTKYGFSIDYPDDWQVNEVNVQESDISLTRYDVVEFYSPSFLRCNSDKTDCVNVRAEVRIEADTHPSSTDLDTFFVKEVARITTGSSIEITKRDAMFKLVGDKAYRLDYSSDSNGEDINALSAYTIKNGVAYIITYHAHAPERDEKTNQFEQYYNDVMTMFSSFNISGGIWKTI